MARAGQDLQRSLECGKGGYGISGLGAGEMLRSEVGCWCFFLRVWEQDAAPVCV